MTGTPMNYLSILHDSDAVIMRLSGENEWSLGLAFVIGEEGPRSFRADVDGKHYRRNRRWL